MANLFAAIPALLEEESFETLAAGNGTRVERIVSRGHTSPATGWYDQAQAEWVVVLRGGAVVEFEDGASVRLEEGDYLDIPAHRRHRVAWTDPARETIWLAVHY